MAKTLMIQGTMSNAGKSILTAGILRILKQDGFRAAPFKSQNMALNSYITREGLEMGRAQVVQAEAAMTEPLADMNPILLKPTNDIGSQVIVQGVSIGNMPAREYFAYKKTLIPKIMESFHRLEENFDVIVIEGAGSPAEINLKKDDIVNMGMAELVDAPVILAGDIDRGGVFAQLYGTVMLLEPKERERVKGLVINKFRGDKTILDPGIQMIEDLCQIPVVGVVPFMNLDIEDEDSLSSALEQKKAGGLVDIAVVRLPRISNFTDFQVFSCIPEVSLRYVSSVKELGRPDLVIIPGTKSTIEDLLWMRSCGLEAAVKKLAGAEIPVFGICGGYQIMGNTITDKEGAEQKAGSPNTQVRGMELLPIDTEFETEKVRTRVAGTFGQVTGILKELSGLEIEGYEIHMGISHSADPDAGFMTQVTETQKSSIISSISKLQKQDGISYGNCYGTYLHGIFDRPGVAEAITRILLKNKGLDGETVAAFDYQRYKEQQYDKLADALRQSLDMKAIYEMMGLKGVEPWQN